MLLRVLVFASAIAWASTAGAEGPAVESPNGKLAFDAARVDGESLQLLDASFAFPITEQVGAQIDAAGGLFSGDDFAYGAGGQLFWRDPELALIGAEALYADRPEEDVAVRRFGAVSEVYRERFTVGGSWGYQNSDLGDGGYASLDFVFYATDDLALRLGGALAPGQKGDQLGIGVEFQPASSGLTLFADGAKGQSSFESVQVGVRYYFDERRSLKQRQRRQDPDGIGGLLASLERSERKRCPSDPFRGPPVLRIEGPPSSPDGCPPPMPMYDAH